MDSVHYLILRYLSENQNGVMPDEFPNEITSHFAYKSIKPGSLTHELLIVLKGQKNWITNVPDTKGYVITEHGKKALQAYKEHLKVLQERQQKEDQLLDLNIEDLVDKVVESPKVKARLQRTEIIAIGSFVAAAISAIVAMKGC